MRQVFYSPLLPTLTYLSVNVLCPVHCKINYGWHLATQLKLCVLTHCLTALKPTQLSQVSDIAFNDFSSLYICALCEYLYLQSYYKWREAAWRY